tara:strand:+ start:302 stop:463 length:162 start_codon:yes stop_codon:yes gene_type:complete
MGAGEIAGEGDSAAERQSELECRSFCGGKRMEGKGDEGEAFELAQVEKGRVGA